MMSKNNSYNRTHCHIHLWALPLLFIQFCLPAIAADKPNAGNSWKLENGQLSIRLSRKSGAIEAVLKKPGEEVWYKNPNASPEIMFLEIPVGLWEGHSALGSQGSGFRIKQQTADSLTLTTKDFTTSEGKFPIEVEIRFRLENDNVVTQLRLTNRGGKAIDQIAFPMLDLAPAADKSESITTASGPKRMREMFSQNEIRNHYDPFERLDPNDLKGWAYSDPAITAKAFEYPSGFMGMHADWMLYKAGDLGVAFDVRDKLFQSQYAVVERKLVRDHVSPTANQQTYKISWHWYPSVAQGQSWESPEVYLKFGCNDWHAVAKQHREWAETWMKRPHVAPKLMSGIGWLSRGITSFDQIPEIAQTGVEVGAPYFLVYGWYIGGMNDLSYGYFPQYWLGGEPVLRENLKKARDLGAYPIAWYNGTTSVESTRENQEEAWRWGIVDRYDGIQVDGRWSLFDPDRPTTTDDATVDLNTDMGTSAAEFNLSNMRRIVDDYGFAGFEMDQAGKNFLSYSPYAKTKRPELNYTNGAREVYEGSQKIVKTADPNFITVTEGISDFENQYSDSSWFFEGAPLIVSYITYLRYSIPWATINVRAINDPGHANQAFMLNSPLDIFLDLKKYTDYADHLKQLHALKEKVYPRFYQGDFSDQDGFAFRPSAPPGVMAKSYIDAGKSTTVVVVNTTSKTQTPTLDFTGASGGSVTNYRLDGSVETVAGMSGLQLHLGPYDVSVLVLEQGGKQ